MVVYLDTETTGLSPKNGDSIVEVAIVDDLGRTLLDTLINPGRSIPWRATEVHGITDEMVLGKPRLEAVIPKINSIVRNNVVVIYNSTFDVPFFPDGLGLSSEVLCAMRRFTAAMGGGQWRKLDYAAKHVGHKWSGVAHRALADSLACRSVWRWLELNAKK